MSFYVPNFFIKKANHFKTKDKCLKLKDRYLKLKDKCLKLKDNYFKIKNLFEEILDIIYPSVCVSCGKINKHWICEDCDKEIKKYRKDVYIKKVNELKIINDITYKENSNLNYLNSVENKTENKKNNERNYKVKIIIRKPYFDEQYYIFE